MKIVYFNYLYDLYGSSIGSTRKGELLMSALQEVGNDVKIYWMKKQPGQEAQSGVTGTTKNFLKRMLARYLHEPKLFLLNLKYLIKENQIINREKPDLIIHRLDLLLCSSLILAKLKKLPIMIEADGPGVYEAHEFQKEFWNIPGLSEYIETLNLSKADRSVCVSNTAREYFIKNGAPAEKLVTITNGANIEKFNPDLDTSDVLEKYNLKGKTVIGFVGSFHYWHGVDNLMEVIKQICKADPDTAFLMVGAGGPMTVELEAFIEKEGLTGRVAMTGYVEHDDMPKHIAAMDIVLAPYPKLKFFYYSPVKLFEYMACGKPVVTTRLGQMAEVITDGDRRRVVRAG